MLWKSFKLNDMSFLYLTLSLVILIHLITSLVQLIYSLQWIRDKETLFFKMKLKTTGRNFFVIVPVLREQKMVLQTLDYMKSLYPAPNLKIIFVTTEREQREKKTGSAPTTLEILKNKVPPLNLTDLKTNNIATYLNEPDGINGKARQINYAFAQLNKLKLLKDQDCIAIYDVDSRPHPETFYYVDFELSTNSTNIIQQPSIFFANLNELRTTNFFIRFFAISNAFLQSRWTLVREIPRMLRRHTILKQTRWNLLITHAVGHGLFLRASFIKQIKGFPEQHIGEDMAFGYEMSALKQQITVMPFLDNAEMPQTFTASMKQKYMWFFGLLDYFSYWRHFNERYAGRSRPLFSFQLALQGFASSFLWLLSGISFVFILLYPFFIRSFPLLLFSIFLFSLYGPLQYLVIFLHNKTLTSCVGEKKILLFSDIFYAIIGSLFAITAHSAPPIASITTKIVNVLTHKKIITYKTERQ